MTTKMTLFLASTSPRRQELIQRLGLPVEVVTNKAEEIIDPSWTPNEAVEQLSKVKARVAYELKMQQTPNLEGILIGADTIVVLDNLILGKPTNEAHAKEMLTALQGRAHRVITGVTLIHLTNGEERTFHQQTKVWMKALNENELDMYIATGEPMDKAGSYGIQGMGALFIEKIEGDYYSVMGLPLNLIYQQLLVIGVNPLLNPLL